MLCFAHILPHMHDCERMRNVKKKIWITAASVAAAAVIVAGVLLGTAAAKKEPEPAAATDSPATAAQSETQPPSTDAPQLSLKLSETRIEVGKTATAETAANASCTGEVQIISSDTAILSVNGTTLTALAPGEVTVYAQCGNAKSEEITVACIIYATGMSLNKESATIKIGDQTTLSASLTPDNRRLRAFEKVELQPGETKTVTLKVKASDLAFVGYDGKWILEKGDFLIQAGDQTANIVCTATKKWESQNK